MEYPMRTTVNIPDNLIKDLLKYSHRKKTTDAVNCAISDWVRLRKIQELKKLRGNLDIEDNLAELKKIDLKRLEKLKK